MPLKSVISGMSRYALLFIDFVRRKIDPISSVLVRIHHTFTLGVSVSCCVYPFVGTEPQIQQSCLFTIFYLAVVENDSRLEDIAPCSLVEVDRRFRGAYCLHHEGDESPC
jgi:hypothetical protein